MQLASYRCGFCGFAVVWCGVPFDVSRLFFAVLVFVVRVWCACCGSISGAWCVVLRFSWGFLRVWWKELAPILPGGLNCWRFSPVLWLCISSRGQSAGVACCNSYHGWRVFSSARFRFGVPGCPFPLEASPVLVVLGVHKKTPESLQAFRGSWCLSFQRVKLSRCLTVRCVPGVFSGSVLLLLF